MEIELKICQTIRKSNYLNPFNFSGPSTMKVLGSSTSLSQFLPDSATKALSIPARMEWAIP